MKKLIFIAVIIAFIISTKLFSRTITIEATGSAILTDNIQASRDTAIKKAIESAIKKILSKSVNENTVKLIKDEAIEGFEVLEEKIEGNILKERVKVLIDESALNDIVKERSGFFYIQLKSYINNAYSKDLTLRLIKSLNSSLTSFMFTDSEEDISVKIQVKKEDVKTLKSVGMTLSNYEIEVEVSKNGEILRKFSISKEITYSSIEEFISKIAEEISSRITNEFKELQFSQSSGPSSFKILEFSVIKPENYSVVKKALDIFENYGIEYDWYAIKDNSISFKLFNISEKKLISILKSENFIAPFKITCKEVHHEGENN